jgi:signal transduction histidine kinase
MNLFPTVRDRLTAWNVGVVACVLIISGFGVRYLLRDGLLRTMDRDLDRQSQFWSGFFGRLRWVGPPANEGEPGPEVRLPSPNGPVLFRPRLLDRQGRDYWRHGPWDRESFDRSLQGERVYRTIVSGGQELRVLSLPGTRRGQIEGVIQIVEPLAATQNALDELTRTLVVLIPVALALAAVGGGFLTRRALQPIREITQAASRIEPHDLSARLPAEGDDELARLAAVLNGMLARLEEAFERQKRFTGDASHELRTPLATIKAHSSLAQADAWGAAECQQAMASIEEATDRASEIVDDLLLLARSDGSRLVTSTTIHGLTAIVHEAARQAQETRRPSQPETHLSFCLPETGELQVAGEPQHLIRLFRNLLDNALRHTPGGQITLTAQGEPTRIVVTVADTGEGIAPEHLPHLGERFYRVDSARDRSRGGFGLGLAICGAIVAAHQGQLHIDSVLGQGTIVTVALPRAEGQE